MADSSVDLGPVVLDTTPSTANGPEPLTGNHVKLEIVTKDHFRDLYESLGPHEEVWTWWPEAGPYTPYDPEFIKWITPALAPGDRLKIYAVRLLSGSDPGKAVGLAFAQPDENLTHRTGEIGALFGPELQRSRAATEVFFLLCCLSFDTLNYRRMAWKTNSLNVHSRAAAERMGLVHEGTLRQEQIFKGRNRDTVIYSMIDSEWPICKKAFETWLGDANFDEQGKQRRSLVEVRESLK
jgi:RimJ/RimL family protein N-acetyltransferase